MFLLHLLLQSSGKRDTIIPLLIFLHSLINSCLLLCTFSFFILSITFLLWINIFLLLLSLCLFHPWLIILRSAPQCDCICLLSWILLRVRRKRSWCSVRQHTCQLPDLRLNVLD